MRRVRFSLPGGIVLLSIVVVGWFNSNTEFGQRGTQLGGIQLGGIQQAVVTWLSPFYVRSYGGKCLDFGPAPAISSPVFIYDCNGTAAQQVVVEQLNGTGNRIVLHAGASVIGAKTPDKFSGGVLGGILNSGFADQVPLELQSYNGSDGQVFVFDGDSIILAADRHLVVEVQNNRGANRTPLVLGRRDLDDSEFWTFMPTDGSDGRPTRGFVRVPVNPSISSGREFAEAVQNALPGTVIEVAAGASIDLTDQPSIAIGNGVTIRGDRHGLRPGPELRVQAINPGFLNGVLDKSGNQRMLEIAGDDVRITGLRLRGPSRYTDGPESTGILVTDGKRNAIIDHNEISEWGTAGVDAYGDDSQEDTCRDHRDPRITRPQTVRIARNFIHHNRRSSLGYGVASFAGAFPLVEGNTFVSNRHAISADGPKCTSYLAWYNLVLFDSPQQHHLFYTQDFDAHGSGGNGFGGQAGQYFEIARNTFLGTNRENFDLRGEPAYLAEVHHNVSLQSFSDAIACSDCGGGINKLRVYDNNQFDAPNPVYSLGVGDFDGDGKDDLFLATGAAWFYSSGGQTEWRLLNTQTDRIGSLRFGDFDGDGRTDVFTQHGRDWVVSWGGSSKFEKINQSNEALNDFAVGDFDGDHRADIFYANGQEWFISFGGTGMFTHFVLANARASDLRFGDFNRDGKTDVFAVVGNEWRVVYGGTHFWVTLRQKLTDSVTNLTVADFDGDGYADIARLSETYDSVHDYVKSTWDISKRGTGAFTTLHASNLLKTAAVGRFNDKAGADLLFWNNATINGLLIANFLVIGTPGPEIAVRYSREDMR